MPLASKASGAIKPTLRSTVSTQNVPKQNSIGGGAGIQRRNTMAAAAQNRLNPGNQGALNGLREADDLDEQDGFDQD